MANEPVLIRKGSWRELVDDDAVASLEKEKTHFYVRQFLNQEGYHSSAFILAQVTTGGSEWSSDATLIVADCNRQIQLDMSLHGDDGRKNTLYKLDLLVETLQQFRKAVKKEAKIVARREAVRERKRQREDAKAKAKKAKAEKPLRVTSKNFGDSLVRGLQEAVEISRERRKAS